MKLPVLDRPTRFALSVLNSTIHGSTRPIVATKPRATSSLILIATLGLVGCGTTVSDDDSTRDESGDVVEGGDVGAFRLQVGDCFAEEAIGDVESVPVVSCEESYDSELYHTFDLPGTDYPGEEAIIESSQQGCLDTFETFVGASYETSIYDISYLYPIEQSWTDINDRTVLCGVYLVDGSLAVGSAAGIGQ
jgi:hypothetical protein